MRKRLLFAAALLTVCLARAPDVYARDYIVKYRDDAAPFDVVDEAELKRLDGAGLLEWYEPDAEMELLDDVPSPYDPSEKWDLAMIHADAAFARGCLGQGVRVGVIDSGVSPHEFLTDSLLEGYNYITDAEPTDTADQFGHGTLVAGLIAGSGADGYIGAAPGAKVVPLKVTDGKYLEVSAVCKAIYGGIDDFECDILNMSFGTNAKSKALEEAIAYAAEHGVVVTAAMGNDGTGELIYPAAYDTVIGVGALDKNGNVSSISNHNDRISLTAPGERVKTTSRSGGVTYGRGTSFAAPYAAAAAAVLLGIDETLTPQEVMALLCETATDGGEPGYDEYYGYGCLNLEGSVEALAERIAQRAKPCAFLSGDSVRNNTDQALRCVYLLAVYDINGRFLGARQWQLLLEAGETAEIEAPNESAGFGQFLLDAETMTPLAMARQSCKTGLRG